MIGLDDEEAAVKTVGGLAGEVTTVGGLEAAYADEGWTGGCRRSSRETKEVALERGWLAGIVRA